MCSTRHSRAGIAAGNDAHQRIRIRAELRALCTRAAAARPGANWVTGTFLGPKLCGVGVPWPEIWQEVDFGV